MPIKYMTGVVALVLSLACGFSCQLMLWLQHWSVSKAQWYTESTETLPYLATDSYKQDHDFSYFI